MFTGINKLKSCHFLIIKPLKKITLFLFYLQKRKNLSKKTNELNNYSTIKTAYSKKVTSKPFGI